MKYQTQLIRIAAAFILFVLLSATFLPSSAQTTFTLEGTALPTPVVGVENDGVQVNAIVTNIGGGEGDNDYYYLSNPVDGGAGMWQTGEDFGDFGISWSDVTTTGTELSRVEADDLIRFNATGMVGTEVSLTLYALKDDDMSAAIAGDGKGNFADFAAARTAFSDISDAQTLSVTVQSPPPTTFELGTLPNPVAGTENGGAQVSTLVTNVMDGSDGDSYYYVSELVDGGAGAWEENDGGGWSAITGTGFIVLESDDFIRFNASPGAVAGTVATLDFYVVNASSEPVDPGALPFISMAQTLSVMVQTSPSIRRVTRTGAGDGSTWATAMTLQAALMASTTAGDQVWIEAGTYKPHADDRTATFRIPGGVLVYGGFLGDEAALADRSGGATTLSGDLLGDDMSRPGEGEDGTAYIASRDDNSYSVVRIAGAGVTLDGLTITAGERGAEIDGSHAGAGLYAMEGATGSVVSNCNFTNNSIAVPGVGFFELAFGGGAFFASAGATLTNCTFTDNSAEPTGLETGIAFMFGGGLAFFQGAAATLTDCIFKNNNAGNGGGLAFFEEAAATLTDCVFENNNADNGGGALFGTESTLTNCVFANNNAAEEGGGLWLQAGGAVINSTFYNNAAKEGGGLQLRVGGTVINSTFYNNTATERGGGVRVTYGGDGDNPFNLRNSILVGNTATTAGNAIYFVDSGAPRRATDIEAVMDYNLIGGGEADLGLELYDGTSETYTAVALADATSVTLTNTIEESNVATVFASIVADEDNFLRLAAGSPALNAGNNDYVNNAAPPITTDAAGEMRIQGDTVDLGAYEGAAAVAPMAQAIAFTSDDTGAVGDDITLAATGGASGLDVTFEITTETLPDGLAATTGEVATLGDDGTTLTLTGVGTVEITATQAGNANYAAATQTQTITVSQGTQTITFTSDTTGTVGMDIELAATASSTLPVTFGITEGDTLATLADNTLSLTGVGTVEITAMQAGNANYASATQTQTIMVDAAPVALNIRRVTTTGAGTGDGSSWAQAMTLQAALAASNEAGNQIWIAEGTYKPHADDRATTFTIPAGGVLVYGGFDGTEADDFDPANNLRTGSETILSGDLSGDDIERPAAGSDQTAYDASRDDNSYTVVTVSGADLTLDGLTISGGERGTEEDNFGNTKYYGAGLYGGSGAGGLTLQNVILRSNNAEHEGGGAYFKSAVSVTNSTFTNNTATEDGGGAYFNWITTITGSTFSNNRTSGGPGGGAYFGSVNITDPNISSVATVTNSTFTNNSVSDDEGGGAYFDGSATVTSCTFSNNSSTGTFTRGGGAYFDDDATVVNCVFANNSVDGNGGGAYFSLFFGNINSTVTNSTFYSNSGNQGGGIYANYGLIPGSNTTNINLRNNILMNNTANFGADELYINTRNASQTANIDNNLIQGGNNEPRVLVITDDSVSISNIVDASDAAVVFASTDSMNATYLRLKAGSPALNAGNNDYLNNGTPGDTDDDITTDAAGNDRIQDGTVDLGAYEGAAMSRMAQTITFTSDTTGTVGTEIELMATASSGLDVTFEITTGDTLATLVDSTLSLTGVGTVTITATQEGNANYANTMQTQTITVSQGTQTITFTSDTTGNVGTNIELAATASSTLPVTFEITTNPATGVATLTDDGTGDGMGSLTLTGAGTITVTASQTGNADYAAATPVERTITVNAVLGIEEVVDDLVLYPNPTSGKLHFSEQVEEFLLYSSEGRLLDTWKNVRSADLTALPSGMYFVEVIRGGRSVGYRIVRK